MMADLPAPGALHRGGQHRQAALIKHETLLMRVILIEHELRHDYGVRLLDHSEFQLRRRCP